ncbi:cytochrome-b5 reductase [Cladophialophora psammophila CBS 110553]|uniref:Cytochrome-b5 reductase n=1 Tax=Cladophialophora psammophila CBS 110553 TaxID=1182543 RepID=W9XD64_9EURO|nr:cytochrome-b5 reductase [Cladophialophora psammophila CBS 110553]EXJ75290.1 cytochrome-b5 reductase [Cladophialophora psammophila CBS 110553]
MDFQADRNGGEGLQEFSVKDVAKHNTKDDVWITIHGKVYDITNYLVEHPGGIQSLIEVAGQDATEAYEDVGHSEDAKEIMAPFLRGTTKGASKVAQKPQRAAAPQKQPTAQKKEGGSSSLLKLKYLPVAGGPLALGLVATRNLPQWSLRSLNLGVVKAIKLNRPDLLGLGDGGFVQGFVVALTLSLAVFAGVAVKVSHAASIESGFLGYPTHIKAVATPAHHPKGFLSPNTYQSLPLVQKEILSGLNLVRLTFELPSPNMVLGLPIGKHVAIKAKVGDQVVTRSYTPTSNDRDPGVLVLVIRIYDDGLLTGGYLSTLNVGDEVDFRGPKGAMKYRKGYAKKIGMVAGGTGITPMYQLIRAICEDDTDTTEVSLVYANRTEDDILLRSDLDRWARAYPKNLKVWYLLDNAPVGWKFGTGYVTKDILTNRMPVPSNDSSSKVLLCGPPGLINAAKKNLVELGWKKPSAVSKMSDDIFCF